jgi:ribosomal protein L11 methyltransferase
VREFHFKDELKPRSGGLQTADEYKGRFGKRPSLASSYTNRTMYLWRKHATPDWLHQHSEELTARYGGTLAIIERAGKRAIVEVVVNHEPAELQREFGGAIERLRAHWLQRFAKQSRSKPLRIGSRLLIGSTPSRNTIVIPAETAFGTGDHATTALCLRMLERLTRALPSGWSMLDAGTGSGILAIAGSRFGAKRIVAIDNDPVACAIARRNARANAVRNIKFRVGDILKFGVAGKFDIIAANLFSEILIAALPMLSRHVSPNGSLILSGILRTQERTLLAAMRRSGWHAQEIKRRGKWIAILAVGTRKRS